MNGPRDYHTDQNESERKIQIPYDVTYAAAAAKSLQSCPTLCNPTDGSPPGSLSLGFSRQEHWSGLPFPSPMRESEVAQSCPTLCDPMDFSLPGSSIHGSFQARVLEWGAIAFSDITYMWSLKYDTNEYKKQKYTHRHREETCGCQGGGGGKRMELGVWD